MQPATVCRDSLSPIVRFGSFGQEMPEVISNAYQLLPPDIMWQASPAREYYSARRFSDPALLADKERPFQPVLNQSSEKPSPREKKKERQKDAATRDRTEDLSNFSAALSHLSYRRLMFWCLQQTNKRVAGAWHLVFPCVCNNAVHELQLLCSGSSLRE